MNRQLVLSIQQHYQTSLNDFCWNNNPLLAETIASLETQENKFYYFWGDAGLGKSHLLQGCCQRLDQKGLSCAYLPLKVLQQWGPETLHGMENQALVAIDDIDTIANDYAWEEALFHLFNRIRDNKHSILLISGEYSPLASSIRLADLRSRLAWGLVFHLEDLDDEQKVMVLQKQAQKRGFDLPDAVALFLIKRCTRNMHNLSAKLEQLDAASLAAQRKITIPFVKEVLDL